MRVLVTGGAGYLGSHVVLSLLEAGHDVDVVESFVGGSPAALARAEGVAGRQVTTHAADVADIDAMERIFATARFDAVVHLAGQRSGRLGDRRVLDTYETNLSSLFTLLRCMTWYEVHRLVLSSSAAVYGPSDDGDALDEESPLAPVSPLGRSLATNEHLLRDLVGQDPTLRVAVVRCFTTAGAHPSGRLGEHTAHAAPGLLTRIGQVAAGRRPVVEVLGGEHATADGTPVRDVVHVVDAAAGHVAALEALESAPGGFTTWNLGSGRATSVLEVIRTFERVTGRAVPHQVVGAAPSTAARLVADPRRAAHALGWHARRGLEEICGDHWRWQLANPDGYPPTVTPETPWRGGVGHRLRTVPPLPDAAAPAAGRPSGPVSP
ncbi:UDP-glucose 4-epimerase GalE [Isoptericola sediminis]|uniref:UDP-glucose 4-epimerase n=1 Tax=Isoptericola sediminis TaxID=2733572 RepID=A0A849K3J1_9MICO|nr:UDP-glucose 4-epimerase GalE [Isoptericola sediminis]NNU26609.1 UDP-glucose 4-epimerase GalE [Isoptericola sediminis]